MGLRATASGVHEQYIDQLRERLGRAGVEQLRFEGVPLDRWTTDRSSLDVLTGAAAGGVPTASYIPYSGRTAAGGVTGQLALVDPNRPPAPGSLAGKIAVFDVPLVSYTYAVFAAITYANKSYDPGDVFIPSHAYARPWLGIGDEITILEGLARSGAVAAVGVLDLPAEAAHGAYYPYDGTIRIVPGVYVDRATGARLAQAAATGETARLALPAVVKRVTSRNLIGVIPGASDELMLLHCHTDGTNGIEDNGPNAIVAMSQYLARLPRRALQRTIMVLLTTGHFHGAIGTAEFVRRHRNDTLRRIAGAVTIEHLGAREWEPGPSGRYGLTGAYEPGTIFAPRAARSSTPRTRRCAALERPPPACCARTSRRREARTGTAGRRRGQTCGRRVPSRAPTTSPDPRICSTGASRRWISSTSRACAAKRSRSPSCSSISREFPVPDYAGSTCSDE